MEQPEARREGRAGAPHVAESPAGKRDEVGDDLRMAPELMLDLARRAAELLVERIEGLPAVTERGKRLLSGIERADSVGLDPHKWLFQPYEVGGLLVKDARTLEQAFAVHHDVLQDTVWGANHPNVSDRGLQLSRSFRALKVRLGEKRRRRRRISGARRTLR